MVKQYKCKFIDPKFNKSCCYQTWEQTNFLAHQRQHFGVKPYQCKVEGCSAAFSALGNFLDHERRHLGDRKYPCPIKHCKSKYYRLHQLKKHMARGKHKLIDPSESTS